MEQGANRKNTQTLHDGIVSVSKTDWNLMIKNSTPSVSN